MSSQGSEESYVHHVLNWLETVNRSKHVDFTKPYVPPSLFYVYPLFVVLYAMVGVIGVAGNAAMLFVIARRRLFHDQTCFLIGNLALSNLIICVFALPITLANLLIQNWLFGSFMCFFLPMLQSFPPHASHLTFLMIAIDRYRLILHPFKSRLPAGLCVIAVWVAAVCTSLPFAIYIKYIDLGATLGSEFDGVGICYIAGEDHIEEYIRAVFVTLYAMPLAVIAFLYVRISAELKSREATTISIHFSSAAAHSSGSTAATAAARELIDHACKASGSWTAPHVGAEASCPRLEVTASTPTGLGEEVQLSGAHHQSQHHPDHQIQLPERAEKGNEQCEEGGDVGSGGESRRAGGGGERRPGGILRNGNSNVTGTDPAGAQGGTIRDSAVRIRSYATAERATQDSDDDLDLAKEKRTQNYLITMTTVFAMCWCPINTLILVNYFVHENDNNEESYDITYTTFTWFGFLSTCTVPVLFASWRMSNATKDRLRGYFRFSNRRHAHNAAQRHRYRQNHYMDRSSCCNIFEEQMIMDRRSISQDGDHV